MSCCGNNRNAAARVAGTLGLRAQAPVEFEYTGSTTLRATGPVTGRDYWFARHGARVTVDARDAPSLEGVPKLTRTARG
jgi:hypothetical protein